MIISLPKSKYNDKPFWYWINERHRIFLVKTRGVLPPWTTDPILQTYRFCNVFRELDKVTIWVRKNWREPYADHPNLWFAMCIARQINHPDTLQEIGFPERWSPDKVRKIMKTRDARGEKVYTGAYIITAGGISGSKIDYTIDHVLTPIWNSDYPHNFFNSYPRTLQLTHHMLMDFKGFGPFMAYEVVSDLRWTRYLKDAEDIYTWANAGPGAKRGLNRLWGRPVSQRLSPDQALKEMRFLLKISAENTMNHVPTMEMRDIEHSLCEVDKYLRVKNGEGRPRAKYEP